MAYISKHGKLIRSKERSAIIDNATQKDMNDKGEFEGSCNITRCQKPNSATWYNHSTRKYYCEDCATMLNNDPFNKRDSLSLWGHDLCTQGLFTVS